MRKTIFFVLTLALACATLALAQQPPPPGGQPGAPPGGPGGMMRGGPMMSCPAMVVGPPPAMMIERGGDMLGLTDEAQKAKLLAILTKSEDALKLLRPKLDLATKALRDALLAPTFDSAKVAQLLADAQKIESAIAASEIQTWGEIRAIPLTADQVTKLSQAMSRRMGGSGGPGDNRGNRGLRGNRGMQPGGPLQGPPPDAPPPPGE